MQTPVQVFCLLSLREYCQILQLSDILVPHRFVFLNLRGLDWRFTAETHIYCKSEIRISKSETNSNYQNWSSGLPTLRAGPQFQMTKTLYSQHLTSLFWTFENSGFVFVSCFGFRISNLSAKHASRGNSNGKQNEVKPHYVTSKNQKRKIVPISYVVLQNCYGFEKLISCFRNICLCEAKSEATYLEGILVG